MPQARTSGAAFPCGCSNVGIGDRGGRPDVKATGLATPENLSICVYLWKAKRTYVTAFLKILMFN